MQVLLTQDIGNKNARLKDDTRFTTHGVAWNSKPKLDRLRGMIIISFIKLVPSWPAPYNNSSATPTPPLFSVGAAFTYVQSCFLFEFDFCLIVF